MSRAQADQDRPNVVLVYMDDMTHWALTSSQCATPNLDRLTAMGTTFTHAFNQGSMDQAVCMPARQMLLTGLSLFHAGERFLDVPHVGEVLGNAGYDTFFTGKWHNEQQALDDDYKVVGPWAGNMLDSTEVGGDAYGRPAPGNVWDPADRSRSGHWMALADGTIQHSTERWTDAAVQFLESDHGADPFFLHLAYHAPHDPRQAPQEFLDMYPADGIRLPPNAWPEHPFDNGELSVRDELLAPHPRTPGAIRMHRREYFAMISHADREFGRILDALAGSGDLENTGALENTVIVFSGDHGLALGEHGLMGKQNPYDHSIRVPLVFAGPGVPAGVRRDDLVYSGSIFPTVCELAGIAIPEHVEFAGLVAAMRGNDPDALCEIFGAYRDVQRLLRTRRDKLVLYPRSGRVQLFDLAADPWEMVDLADSPDAAGRVDELAARLRARQAELGDPDLGADAIGIQPVTSEVSGG